MMLRATVEAWWDAWLAFWSFVEEDHDEDLKRDLRSIERNAILDALDPGGSCWSAGTGSDAD